MKKKMSTNTLIRWLEGWVSQTHRMENHDNAILDVFWCQKTKSNISGGIKKF